MMDRAKAFNSFVDGNNFFTIFVFATFIVFFCLNHIYRVVVIMFKPSTLLTILEKVKMMNPREKVYETKFQRT